MSAMVGPALRLPNYRPPEGWDLSLLTGGKPVSTTIPVAPDGKKVALFVTTSTGPKYLLSRLRGAGLAPDHQPHATQFWWDEIPRWSPDSAWLLSASMGTCTSSPSTGREIPSIISDFGVGASSRYGCQTATACDHQRRATGIPSLLLTDPWEAGLPTDYRRRQ